MYKSERWPVGTLSAKVVSTETLCTPVKSPHSASAAQSAPKTRLPSPPASAFRKPPPTMSTAANATAEHAPSTPAARRRRCRRSTPASIITPTGSADMNVTSPSTPDPTPTSTVEPVRSSMNALSCDWPIRLRAVEKAKLYTSASLTLRFVPASSIAPAAAAAAALSRARRPRAAGHPLPSSPLARGRGGEGEGGRGGGGGAPRARLVPPPALMPSRKVPRAKKKNCMRSDSLSGNKIQRLFQLALRRGTYDYVL